MRRIWGVVIGGAMVAALMVGCGDQKTEVEETVANKELEVEESENVVEAWGHVDAQTIKQIYLDFPATISKIYVEDGQEVKKGDKLINIDYSDYEANILMKQTELGIDKIAADSAKQSLEGNRYQISVLQKKADVLSQNLAKGTDADINMQQDIITEAENNLKKLKKNLALQEELLAQGAGALEDVNNLKLDIENLNNKIATAKQRIIDLNKQKNIELSDLKASIAVLQDAIHNTNNQTESQADTYSVKQEISNIEIGQMTDKINNIDLKGNDIINSVPKGIIKSVSAVEGNKVGENGAALIEIIDKDSLVVKANVPEEFIKDVKVGAEVNIIPYADREAKFKGKVKEIQQMAIKDNGEVVIPVVIEATDSNPYLCYGYSVDVEIYH